MITLTAAVTAAIICTTVPSGQACSDDPPPVKPAHQFPLCSAEDDNFCVWRANVQGDGQGTSFVAGRDEFDVTHVSHRVARNVHRANDWFRATPTWIGLTIDLVDNAGGTRTVTRNTHISVGDTTYFIWPRRGRVGSS